LIPAPKKTKKKKKNQQKYIERSMPETERVATT
jgi:hypothetical protein